MKRILPALILFMFALAPAAAACPTCGIGGKLGFLGPVIYGLFMSAPFFISYGIYRYIRNLQDRVK
ncbi:MAG: hypothetical protein HY286_19515 [Planctomycetes bacterium]|nr:hypothetical protein [Planctomycetota bacterium]